MARTGRVKSKIGVYHILLRGMNELFGEERDYYEFVDILRKYSASGTIKVFSYTLLKNRIHLVVGVSESIGIALKPLCTSYARYFNRTYQREGKLFYDRLKSEPIDTYDSLKNVVAFVNSISANISPDYPYSSLSSAGKEICVPGILSQSELSNTALSEMFIEDYDCLSREEIEQYIFSICHISPEDFSNLSSDDKKEALARLTKKRWIAKNKLYDILGINRPRQITNSPTKTISEEKKNDRELSIWLL